MSRVRTAVVGVGYFGRFHAEKLAELPESELIAVVDANADTAGQVATALGVRALTDHRELIGEVDAVSVAVPTRLHFAVARDFLESGVHVLLEKPMAATVTEADALIDLASRQRLVLQVGHIERMHPAVRALEGVLDQPLFIEAHRITPFRPRSTDVDVVLDLMIHDIDIIRSVVRSPIERIDASGIAVLSRYSDIANARIRFECGCVANVTASRAGNKSERRMRVFQRDAYIAIDFQNHRLTVRRKGAGEMFPGVPEIVSEDTDFARQDTLREEIAAFLRAIRTGGEPLVSGEDGRRALATALAITRSVEHLSPRPA